MPVGLANTVAHRQRPGARGAGGVVVEPAQFVFPGAVGNYLSVAPSEVPVISGDLDVRARLAPTNGWSNGGAQQTIVAHYTTLGNQRSWRFVLSTTGRPQLFVSRDGATTEQPSALQTPTEPVLWLRVTRVAATGEVVFYVAPDSTGEPTQWQQWGTQGSTTPGPLFAATAPLRIGQLDASGAEQPFNGRIRRVIIRDGIDGPVVFDCGDGNADPSASSFVCATGQTVTETGDVIKPLPASNFSFDGNSGNYLQLVETVDLSGDGLLVITARVAVADFADPTFRAIAAKHSGSSIEFLLRKPSATGRLSYVFTNDADGSFVSATRALPYANGVMFWVRVTHDPAAGTVAFQHAPDGPHVPTTWTHAGTFPVVGTRRAVSTPLQIGWDNSATPPFHGRISRLVIEHRGRVVVDVGEGDCHDPDDRSFISSSSHHVTEFGSVIVPAP